MALKDRVTPMVILGGQVAAQEIHLAASDQLILGAQAQRGREILEELQIQEQVADSMAVEAAALVLREKLKHYKDMAVMVIYG